MKVTAFVLAVMAVAAISCEKNPTSAGVSILVATDLLIPKDIDRIAFSVFRDGASIDKGTIELEASPPNWPIKLRQLDGMAGTTIRVEVAGERDGRIRVQREVEFVMPDAGQREIVVELQWLCLGVDECGTGKTCGNGSCVSNRVQQDALAMAQQRSGEGSKCFATEPCFAGDSGQRVEIDKTDCSFSPGPISVGLNVSLVLAPGSDGVCDAQKCLVPLNGFSEGSGWTLIDGRVSLPRAVCTAIEASTAQGVWVSTVCPTKTLSVPVCNRDANVENNDGGPAQDAGSQRGDGGTVDARSAAPAQLRSSTPQRDYGFVVTGTQSAAATFSLTNVGDEPSGVIALSLTGTGAAQFSLQAGGNCGRALAPGASCSFSLVFSPNVAAKHDAALRASATPGGTLLVSLTGVGVAPAALLASPSTLTFPPQRLSTTSNFQTITLSNSGEVQTGSIGVSLGGDHPGDFILNHNCVDLARNATCSINIAFRPGTRGDRAATLQLSATPGGVALVNLGGRGQADAALRSDGGQLSFGAVVLGASHAGLTVRLSNAGDLATGFPVFKLAGSHPGDFALIPGGTCGAVLSAGQSCDQSLTFKPTAVGTRTSTLAIETTPGGSVSIQLSGTGLNPASLVMEPNALNYPAQFMGTQSTAQNITIRNTGDVQTGVLTITSGGPHAADFTQTIQCPTRLQPSESCTVASVFTPSAPGTRTATVQISGTPGGTAVTNLVGIGTATVALYTDTPYGTLTIGPDGTSLYFARWSDGSVIKGSTAGAAPELIAITQGSQMRAMCTSSKVNATYLYVMGFSTNQLFRITIGSWAMDQISVSPTLGAPHACAVSPDEGTIYIGSVATGTAHAAPAPGGDQVALAPQAGYVQFALSRSGTTLFSTNDGDGVFSLAAQVANGTAMRLSVPGQITKATGIVLSLDEQTLYVADDARVGSGGALPARILALPSGGGNARVMFTANADSFQSPVFLAIDPSGSRLYVSDPGHYGNGGIHVVAIPADFR